LIKTYFILDLKDLFSKHITNFRFENRKSDKLHWRFPQFSKHITNFRFENRKNERSFRGFQSPVSLSTALFKIIINKGL